MYVPPHVQVSLLLLGRIVNPAGEEARLIGQGHVGLVGFESS
jgi:hypothetical protein